MPDCCNPAGYQRFFDDEEARRSLRNYEKKGLDAITAGMVDYLISRGVKDRSVLEAGGGIGAIQVELLKAGAERTINVELSPGYESVAIELLHREGLADRAERLLGDFTTVAADLSADDVVMNRVICCYPFMERLMGVALASSRRFVAAVYPRGHLANRLTVSVENVYHRLRGLDFRGYVHPPDRIVAIAESSDFRVVYQADNLVWRSVVFEKTA